MNSKLLRPVSCLIGLAWSCCISLLLVSLIVVLGCATDLGKQQESILKQSNKALEGYFRGEAVEARRSLKQAIGIIEETTLLEPSGHAYLLFVHYSRLYVLEETTGDKAATEVALVKLRYWSLRALELRKYTADSALAELEPFWHPEKIKETVEKADRAFNSGKLPRYAQSS